MDYEKEYKSLVAKVKKAHQFAQTDSTKSVLEDILPQLRESEDERNWKAVLEYIKDDSLRSWLESQKEQKPAEKQDYSGLTDLERAIHRGFLSAGVENVPVEIIKETANECKRTQTIANENANAEWSEEDEKMRQRIIRHIESEYQDWCKDKYGNSEIISDGKESCRERIAWLKSLRPQPHWKPSEKQEEPEYYQHFDPDC